MAPRANSGSVLRFFEIFDPRTERRAEIPLQIADNLVDRIFAESRIEAFGHLGQNSSIE
jgi:hypothetical protein